ncbi:hypothetical protein BJ138DRAFT_1016684 [Hygrophoropsis aurantiaca]|uniref:Uncharacterized protein n=1 Tax=Hygrophoropsis aurantiaca TaxID=72124 RepID=A0ACB7ZZL8_9AGAM|nr:hypothetical protein BJ138DRAFT_1016684 [Hygrophoropsis aurantiaca]
MNQPSSACASWTDDLANTAENSTFQTDRQPTASNSFSQDNLDRQDIIEENTFGFGNHEQDFQSVGQEDFPHINGPISDYFEGAAHAYDGGRKFMDDFYADAHAEKRRGNLFYPFASKAEWKFASWLLRSSLSLAMINSLLSLEIIQRLNLSFKNAQELRLRAEMLPSGPQWKYQVVKTSLPTKHPARIFYRDPVECLQALLSNPLFAPHISFVPRKVWTSSARLIRVYDEWLSGDRAWEMQSQIAPGASLLGVVLSSDKTNISIMTGNRMAHPLLISLANIDSNIRSKTSLNAYALLALLPVAKFIHPKSRVCSMSQDRLFHQCLDLVLKPLKVAAMVGIMMSDPAGQLRYCFTPLAAYIADTPEEALLASISARSSPVLNLNGVLEPFWRDWPMSDPSSFILTEPLHHFFRMSWDHDVKWCLNVVGEDETDYRFNLVQTLIGYRHFEEGISKLKQVTGRDHRSVQRYIVGVIADAVPQRFLSAIRALVDFRYLAQAPRFTDKTLELVSAALIGFHNNKAAILQAGGRAGKNGPMDHFNIPKLELLQSVVTNICAAGAIIQWSADVTEHSHVTLIKDPARSGNNQNYYSQISRHLDRAEKCFRFDLATTLDDETLDDVNNDNDSDEDEHEPDEESNRIANYISPTRKIVNYFQIAEALQAGDVPNAPCPFRTFATSTTAIHLAAKPSLRMTVDEAAAAFELPDLRPAIADFLARETRNQPHDFSGRRYAQVGCSLPFDRVQIWCKIRVQQTTYHDPSSVEPAHSLRIQPPSNSYPKGIYDSVVVNSAMHSDWPAHGLKDHSVAQLRLIFRPLHSDIFLAYIQRFDLVSPAVDPHTGMHWLRRAVRRNGDRIGDIIPLSQIRSPAPLIPHFGKKANSRLNSRTCYEVLTDFWLNKFWNKEFYYAMTDFPV